MVVLNADLSTKEGTMEIDRVDTAFGVHIYLDTIDVVSNVGTLGKTNRVNVHHFFVF